MRLYNEEELKKNSEANCGRAYQQCVMSVMDTIADPDISFDENGICNYYYEFLKARENNVFDNDEGEKKLAKIIDDIKKSSNGKKYDCIAGVSGGVDSTYVALKAKEFGLNPLIVHFDNGWNSEMANQNINNIISKLGFDLYTLVVDWNEFRDIQRAYFKANVVDIEAITDHAILATVYQLAEKHKIKYLLSGANIVTEHTLPNHWIWGKSDSKNVKSIHNKFGEVKLKTFPFLSGLRKLKIQKQIKSIPILDYLPYDKETVKKEIQTKLGWQDYGGKHYESIFTRFYQGYILPVKFGIDKRKAHLSTLIFDGKLSKEEATKLLEHPIYPNSELLVQDYEFVLKKLGFSKEEFEEYLMSPRTEHSVFDYEKNNIWDNYPSLKLIRPLWKLIRK